MLGRSDGVLNPGGIRFGPTDIYSVLENDEYSKMGIEETLVVGLMVEGGSDEKVILFVKVYLRLFYTTWRLTGRCGVRKRLARN
jgi:acetoacetyl-CoA synthetase